MTARDHLSVHWATESLERILIDFERLPVEEIRQKYQLGKDSSDWNVGAAQKDVRISHNPHSMIESMLYRPFDFRWTFFLAYLRGLFVALGPK